MWEDLDIDMLECNETFHEKCKALWASEDPFSIDLDEYADYIRNLNITNEGTSSSTLEE